MSTTQQMGVFQQPAKQEGNNMPEKETESSFDAAAEVARPELEELLEGMTEEERQRREKGFKLAEEMVSAGRPQTPRPHYR